MWCLVPHWCLDSGLWTLWSSWCAFRSYLECRRCLLHSRGLSYHMLLQYELSMFAQLCLNRSGDVCRLTKRLMFAQNSLEFLCLLEWSILISSCSLCVYLAALISYFRSFFIFSIVVRICFGWRPWVRSVLKCLFDHVFYPYFVCVCTRAPRWFWGGLWPVQWLEYFLFILLTNDSQASMTSCSASDDGNNEQYVSVMESMLFSFQVSRFKL